MSSSSDLETPLTQQIVRKRPKKIAKKSKPPATPTVTDHGKNEGDDPHWAYEPPDGAVLLDHTVDVGAFEWGAVKDDEDTEVWFIRVPETIKAKHLDGLVIDPPSSSRTARIGSLTRKSTAYDVWSIGDDDDDEIAGADELHGLTCLLPRRRKNGRLYVAPKRVAHRIVVSARPSVPTLPEHQPVVYQNPPRASYPKDVFKHAFVPYGARSKVTQSEDVSTDMDDVEIAWDKPASGEAPPSKDKCSKTKESKGKKRKVEGGLPKKSKKHKTDG